MSEWKIWYENLKKPDWTPEGVVIGAIWTILYPIIAVSLLIVAYKVWQGDWSKTTLTIFAVNLVANLLFFPVMFLMKNLSLATLDILVVLGTIIAEIIMVWQYSHLLAVAQLPYLIWVCIATYLQVHISLENQ